MSKMGKKILYTLTLITHKESKNERKQEKTGILRKQLREVHLQEEKWDYLFQ